MFWYCYVLKLLRFESIIYSDATLSDINVVLCYVLSQYPENCTWPAELCGATLPSLITCTRTYSLTYLIPTLYMSTLLLGSLVLWLTLLLITDTHVWNGRTRFLRETEHKSVYPPCLCYCILFPIRLFMKKKQYIRVWSFPSGRHCVQIMQMRRFNYTTFLSHQTSSLLQENSK
jgi:hypothetical protein